VLGAYRVSQPYGVIRERGRFAAKPTLPHTVLSDWDLPRGGGRPYRRVTACVEFFDTLLEAHRRTVLHLMDSWHDYTVIKNSVLVGSCSLQTQCGGPVYCGVPLCFSPVDEIESLTSVLRVTMNALINDPALSFWRAGVVARLHALRASAVDLDAVLLLPAEVRQCFRRQGAYLIDESEDVAFCFGAFKPAFALLPGDPASRVAVALTNTFAHVEWRRRRSLPGFSATEFWVRLQHEMAVSHVASKRNAAFAALREQLSHRGSNVPRGDGLRDHRRVQRSRTVPASTVSPSRLPLERNRHDVSERAADDIARDKGTPSRIPRKAAVGFPSRFQAETIARSDVYRGERAPFMTKSLFSTTTSASSVGVLEGSPDAHHPLAFREGGALFSERQSSMQHAATLPPAPAALKQPARAIADVALRSSRAPVMTASLFERASR